MHVCDSCHTSHNICNVYLAVPTPSACIDAASDIHLSNLLPSAGDPFGLAA